MVFSRASTFQLKYLVKKIGLLRRLHHMLPRSSLLTIYESFIRPHLGFGDIIYDQTYYATLHQKLKSIQYNVALAITGTARGAYKEKLYNELGLETLEKRRWYRKLCCLFKIFKYQCSKYISNAIYPILSFCEYEDLLNPICSRGKDIETSTRFLLLCPSYSNKRSTFLKHR